MGGAPSSPSSSSLVTKQKKKKHNKSNNIVHSSDDGIQPYIHAHSLSPSASAAAASASCVLIASDEPLSSSLSLPAGDYDRLLITWGHDWQTLSYTDACIGIGHCRTEAQMKVMGSKGNDAKGNAIDDHWIPEITTRVTILECLIPRVPVGIGLPRVIPSGSGNAPSPAVLAERERAQHWWSSSSPSQPEQPPPSIIVRTRFAGCAWSLYRTATVAAWSSHIDALHQDHYYDDTSGLINTSQLILMGPPLTLHEPSNQRLRADHKQTNGGYPLDHYNLYWIHPLTLQPVTLLHHLPLSFQILQCVTYTTGWLLVCIMDAEDPYDELHRRYQHQQREAVWKKQQQQQKAYKSYPHHYNMGDHKDKKRIYLFVNQHDGALRVLPWSHVISVSSSRGSRLRCVYPNGSRMQYQSMAPEYDTWRRQLSAWIQPSRIDGTGDSDHPTTTTYLPLPLIDIIMEYHNASYQLYTRLTTLIAVTEDQREIIMMDPRTWTEIKRVPARADLLQLLSYGHHQSLSGKNVDTHWNMEIQPLWCLDPIHNNILMVLLYDDTKLNGDMKDIRESMRWAVLDPTAAPASHDSDDEKPSSSPQQQQQLSGERRLPEMKSCHRYRMQRGEIWSSWCGHYLFVRPSHETEYYTPEKLKHARNMILTFDVRTRTWFDQSPPLLSPPTLPPLPLTMLQAIAAATAAAATDDRDTDAVTAVTTAVTTKTIDQKADTKQSTAGSIETSSINDMYWRDDGELIPVSRSTRGIKTLWRLAYDRELSTIRARLDLALGSRFGTGTSPVVSYGHRKIIWLDHEYCYLYVDYERERWCRLQLPTNHLYTSNLGKYNPGRYRTSLTPYTITPEMVEARTAKAATAASAVTTK